MSEEQAGSDWGREYYNDKVLWNKKVINGFINYKFTNSMYFVKKSHKGNESIIADIICWTIRLPCSMCLSVQLINFPIVTKKTEKTNK